MFEEKTYEVLLQEKLDQVSDAFDKREGSVIYDALAPNSAEQAQMYITLEWMFQQMFGDTASREYLIKIAKDTRGLTPKKATYAIVKGEFDQAVAVGSRFSYEDLNYAVTELIDATAHTYQMQCETTGRVGNVSYGILIPINYIDGLTSAKITEVLIAGEEEEDTEVFRKRWRAAFNATAFGGNRTDYMEKINAIEGVGGCNCYRTTNEQGEKVGAHVKCVIIASDGINYSVPSDILIAKVQEKIDPTKDQAGVGIAPIGHIVHVIGVTEKSIDIEATITCTAGYLLEDIKSGINEAIDTYFKELAKAWAESENKEDALVVNLYIIANAILKVSGVKDVAGIKLNGVQQNITLDADAIPKRGECNWIES